MVKDSKAKQKTGGARSVKSISSRSSRALGEDKYGRKIRVCQLCDNQSDAESPLITASPNDKFQGCLPWRSTKARTAMVDGKLLTIDDPDGKMCTICNNVWRILGKPPLLSASSIATPLPEPCGTHVSASFLELSGLLFPACSELALIWLAGPCAFCCSSTPCTFWLALSCLVCLICRAVMQLLARGMFAFERGRPCVKCNLQQRAHAARLRASPGKDEEFTSAQEYHNYVSQDQNRHAVFLRARDKFISKHNENPEGARVCGAEELRQLKSLQTEEKTTERWPAPA